MGYSAWGCKSQTSLVTKPPTPLSHTSAHSLASLQRAVMKLHSYAH